MTTLSAVTQMLRHAKAEKFKRSLQGGSGSGSPGSLSQNQERFQSENLYENTISAVLIHHEVIMK